MGLLRWSEAKGFGSPETTGVSKHSIAPPAWVDVRVRSFAVQGLTDSCDILDVCFGDQLAGSVTL